MVYEAFYIRALIPSCPFYLMSPFHSTLSEVLATLKHVMPSSPLFPPSFFYQESLPSLLSAPIVFLPCSA